MPQIVQIIAAPGTTSPGPYNVYYDSITPSNLVATLTLAQFLAGATVSVPDTATNITAQNVNAACGNYQIYAISLTPVTFPPTPAPTTAAPTTAPTTAPTAAPTTTAPTVAPTTAAPTTAPVTAAPTTAAPTTAPTVAPTTAPTVAPTPAPTTTYYEYTLYGFGYSTAGDACYYQPTDLGVTVYAAQGTINSVTRFYSDSNLFTPIVGGDQWWAFKDLLNNINRAQISNGGFLSNNASC
jgi:hypothetical protein